METIVEALKNLYAAFGGNIENVETITNIAEMVNALAEHVSSGGAAELPEVTTEDNGKVLTVVSGKWEKANLPG